MANVNITVPSRFKTINKKQRVFIFTFHPKPMFFRLVERFLDTLVRSVFWNWLDSVFVFGKVKLKILIIYNTFPLGSIEAFLLDGLSILLRNHYCDLLTYFHFLYYLIR